MRIRALSKHTKPALVALLLLAICYASVQAFSVVVSPIVKASIYDKFDPENIISDSYFTASTSMSASSIQNFLENKNSVCLKDFKTLGLYDSNNDGLGDEPYGKGTGKKVLASKLIEQAAKLYKISPKVILVTLQKEQGLITRTDCPQWRYNTALGYGCPDSAPCDNTAYGFTRQIDYGVWHMRGFFDDTYPIPPRVPGVQSVAYNPDSRCGSKTINIRNRATSALYSYTPYQPNNYALNGGSDSSYPKCGAFGNRNFFYYYTLWFGGTHKNYDASIESVKYYSDAARTNEIDLSSTSLNMGDKVYVRVEALNTGKKNFGSFVRIATYDPKNRSNSKFHDSTWESKGRPVSLSESSVSPGNVGTFDFVVNAPQSVGTVKEKFGFVAENRGWMGNEFQISLTTQAEPGYSVRVKSIKTYTNSGLTKTLPSNSSVQPGKTVYVKVRAQNTGTNDLESFIRVATVNPRNRSNSQFYDTSWESKGRPVRLSETTVAPGGTGTFVFALKAPDTDGEYSEDFGFVAENIEWIDNQYEEFVLSLKVRTITTTLHSGSIIYSTDSPAKLESNNGSYRFVMQNDGNLVLYKKNGRAVWSSGTHGGGSSRIVMQGDGNLVVYRSSGKSVWSSGTHGNGTSRLVMQNDGNLVIYKANGKAVWSTGTRGA